MTLSMTVNYLGQVQGKRLIATARKTGGGRSTYFAEAMVKDELGNPIASGVGTFRLRSRNK
jgi:acyl-coenzyme A thioesterase PaaI-like protein